MAKKWSISLNNFKGFAPNWWDNYYASQVDARQARDMTDIDLFYSNDIKQGPGISTLTDGDDSGVVDTLINQILDFPPENNITFGIGENKLYKMTKTALTDDANWPHTIDKGSVTDEDGESVCYYKGNLYYSYNHSGDEGDVGKYDMSTTFDDDYMSTTPTGAAALEGGVPHHMINGKDNKMYIANGQYIASFDGTTFNNNALDFLEGSEVKALAWSNNSLLAAVNKTSLSGDNKIQSSIYIWNTTSASWSYEISVNGRLGALHVKNGIVYVWWEELVEDSSVYKFGYINGRQLIELATYLESDSSTNALPHYGQVTDYKGSIVWFKYENIAKTLAYDTTVDDSDVDVDDANYTVDNYETTTETGIIAFKPSGPTGPARLFQFISPKYTTVGAVANSFGLIFLASTDGSSSYDLSKDADYSDSSLWKTPYFRVGNANFRGHVNKIVIYTKPISDGVNIKGMLDLDGGDKEKMLNTVTFSGGCNKVRHVLLDQSVPCDDFSFRLDLSGTTTTIQVVVKDIYIEGEFVEAK